MSSQPPAADRYELGELGLKLPIGVFRTSADGEFLAANEVMASLLGCESADDVIGRNAIDFYVNLRQRAELMTLVRADGEIRGVDHRLRRLDGSVVWVRNSSRAALDDDGNIQHYEGVLEDVTEERASRELWHRAFDEAPVGMAISTTEGYAVQVNEALCRLLGYSEDEMMATSLLGLVHPSDMDDANDRRVRIVNGVDSPAPVARRLRKKDGSYVPALIGASALHAPAGEVQAILSQVIDVSRAEEYQAALRDSEERLRSAFEDAPIGMVLSDESDLLRINAAFCSMLGYTEAELYETGVSALVHADDKEGLQERVSELFRGETRRYQIDRRFRHKDGHYLWARISAGAVRLPGGRRGMLSHVEDVTERVEVLETIQRSVAENQALLDSIPDLMFRLDREGRYTWFRPGFDLDPAVPPEAFMGKRIADLFPHLADPISKTIDRLYETGEPQSLEYQIEMPEGLRDFESRFVRVGDGDFLLLVRDVTEQHERRHQLEQLLQSKDEFVASLGHELRNPLTTVVGIAQELTDSWDRFTPEKARDMVKLMLEDARDMADLIEDLLAAARAGVGMITVDRVETDLVQELLGVLAAWPSGTAQVITRGKVVAVADPFRVRQILRNLISNADRHGGPEVTIKVERRPATAVIKVCDDGPALAAGDRDLIFDPYYVASSYKGSVGLGLSVSRTLARLMGGDLEYHHDGASSIFELRLPSTT